mgnify:CR=1 FL=1
MIRSSGFGEVFVAMDNTSNDLVAIKKLRLCMEPGQVENESRLLKECKSKFIVRYFDVIRSESELWVSCLCGI